MNESDTAHMRLIGKRIKTGWYVDTAIRAAKTLEDVLFLGEQNAQLYEELDRLREQNHQTSGVEDE